MNTKNIFLPLILILFFTTRLFAQSGGSISGTLIDGANSQPLSFASVVVTKKNDAQPPKNMQSDIDGKFTVKGLSNGTYTVRVSYVGYLSFLKDTIVINNTKKNITLANITLRPSKGALKEVTVTAQRDQIKLGIDKKSFSVAESLVSQGGSATDLLANVPSVQVDVDGNLSLRGSSSVRVLINGKQSTLTGGNLADILQSIPASSIETIEVITNPSSKYEAEGQSGIINIVLKKNVKTGFTGSASITAGTQQTVNGSVSLAYQTKKINVYGNYSYRKSNRDGGGFSTKNTSEIVSGSPVLQHSDQLNNQTFDFGGHNIRSGIDFFLNDKNTLSLSDNINIRDRSRFQSGSTTVTQNGALYQTQTQNNVSTGSGTNVDLNLDFEHKFAKKQEVLTANLGFSNDLNNGNDQLSTIITNYSPPVLPSSIFNNYTNGHDNSFNIQTDYTLPLKDGQIEAGYRTTLSKSDNNNMVNPFAAGSFYYDPLQSNDLIYKQNVNAVYGNYQHQFGKFGIQGGLRLEDSHISTELSTNNVITNNRQDYLRLYPTLFLTEKINDNQTIQLSYSRRVSRPNSRFLSPFLDKSNVLNYQQGNPNLKPEDTHSIELSYINYWKALTLTSSLYYRLTNDNIQPVSTLLDANTTLSTFQNLSSASNSGYELIAKLSPSSIFDITANVNAYYRRIEGYAPYNIPTTSGFAWNGNLTASIKPTKAFGIQLRGDYQGSQVLAQGTMHARYGLDGGVKYDLTKQLTLSVNSRDIFNTRKFVSDTHLATATIVSDQYSERRFSTRTILFTLSYRIGGNSNSAPGKGRKGGKGKVDSKDTKDNSLQSPDQEDDFGGDINGGGIGTGVGGAGGGPGGPGAGGVGGGRPAPVQR
ncbi:MAG: TonB-dependent receptor [Mucilaginibacter sp.]